MAEILLSKGYVAIIDDADFEWLDQWKWFATPSHRTFYAKRQVGSRRVVMHRLIIGCPTGAYVDHVNGDGLDNRRTNLRVCSLAENNRNTGVRRDSRSGLKGVEELPYGRWRATIWAGGCRNHLGIFDNRDDAARAYDAAALAQYGPFARLNFPLEAA